VGSRELQFATFLAPSVRPFYEAVASLVGDALGMPTHLRTGRSFDELSDGSTDVAFVCGLPYVRLGRADPPRAELLAAPVLAGERYGGRPIYFSDVIVRHDDQATSVEDLRDRAWSYNDRDSHSGWSLTRAELAARGLTWAHFSRVVEAGFHQRSIAMVASGEVDASAIDSQVLAVALTEDPGLADAVRVIDVFGPSTIQPVVASSRLDAGLREDARRVLIDLDATASPTFAAAGVERLVAIDDATYDDIRAMERAGEPIGEPADVGYPTTS